MKRNESLSQFFIPVWAAEMIINHYYPKLSERDVVFDIGCGDGRFLKALPPHVKAYGFELDSSLAKEAKNNTGRNIVSGDFRNVAFPEKPTLFIGNPPFSMSVVNPLLDRAYEALDWNQEAGLVLPVYFFQTADTVMEYNEKWTLRHELLPRNMFEGIEKPLMFARFIKEKNTTLVGMFLYTETSDILSLKKKYRCLFWGNTSSTHLWGEVIDKALLSLGGQAHLKQIYAEIEGKRPTKTEHWKAQIRKVLQQFYDRVGPGIYSLKMLKESSQLALSV